MARDDFKPGDIDKLARRVAYLCTRCENVTVGPKSGPAGVSNVGVAAHICAAAPGGPRYDLDMTPAQRSDIKNGIWLCHTCSREVDNDPASYPVDLLLRWKTDAEARAKNRIGKRHLNDRDVQAQMKSMMGTMPGPFQLSAIANVHGAARQSLQALDNRFTVETSYTGNQQHITLHPKETVQMKFKVPQYRSAEWNEKLTALLDHGKSARLSAEGVLIEGSPLLESLSSDMQQVSMQIAAKKIDATVRIRLKHPKTGVSRSLEEFQGTMSGGRKTSTIECTSYGGLVALSYGLGNHVDEIEAHSFQFIHDGANWNGKDVRYLQSFIPVFQIFEALHDGWEITFDLAINGNKAMSGSLGVAAGDPYFKNIMASLGYLDRVRRLADLLDVSVPYVHGFLFTKDEHVALAEVLDIAEGKAGGKVVSDVTATIEITSEEFEGKWNPQDYNFLMLNAADSMTTVKVFNTRLELPAVSLLIEDIAFKPGCMPDSLKVGDTVEAVWVPGPDTRATYRYATDPKVQAIQPPALPQSP